MRKLALVLCAPVLLLTASASAHFTLEMPPPPKPSVDGKGPPPCGPDVTDGTVTPVTGGTQLMIAINETVDHGGFYRVALATKACKTGTDCFPADNKVYDDKNMALNPTGPGTSDHADYDMNPKFPILADHLFAHPLTGQGKKYSGMVDIPNMNCEKCTMQIIEFMEQHGPNGNAGYFYHHCADLKITADTNKPIFDPANPGGGGTGGTGAGGSAGAAGTGGGASAGAASGGTGGSGVATGGGGSGGTTGSPLAGTGGTGVATGGTGVATAGTAAGGSGTAGTGGSGDDGGCGIARGASGGASALAALGVLLGLVRRRRSR